MLYNVLHNLANYLSVAGSPQLTPIPFGSSKFDPSYCASSPTARDYYIMERFGKCSPGEGNVFGCGGPHQQSHTVAKVRLRNSECGK